MSLYNDFAAGFRAPGHSNTNDATGVSAQQTDILHAEHLLEAKQGFIALDKKQQAKALAVFHALNSNPDNKVNHGPTANAELLNNLLQLKSHDGTPLVLSSHNNGATVLDSLKAIACSKEGHPYLAKNGIKTAEVLGSLVKDLIESAGINQGKKSTCPVTSAQWFFARNSSAMYAGQMAEAVTTGQVLGKNNNVVMELPATLSKDKRSVSSSLYQTMTMGAVDGGYDALNDKVNGLVGKHPGLYARQLELLMEKVTGEAMLRIDHNNSSYEALKQHVDRSTNKNSPSLIIAAVRGIGSGEHMLHDVNVTERRDGRIFFRNPWGAEYLEAGKAGGLARVEDAKEAIYSMNEEEFLKNCDYMIVRNPDQSAIAFGETAGATDELEGYKGDRVPFFTADKFNFEYKTALQANLTITKSADSEIHSKAKELKGDEVAKKKDEEMESREPKKNLRWEVSKSPTRRKSSNVFQVPKSAWIDDDTEVG